MVMPDYKGGSIVNLMASIMSARGGGVSDYPQLSLLSPYALQDVRNLVLIVIDGLGYEFLTHASESGTLRRHLRGKITSVFPSTTATAITTFLTGSAPQQHALTGWFTYFKEVDSITAVLPFTKRHDGTNLSESGINAAEFFQHIPIFDNIETPSFVVVPEHIAYSDFNLSHSGKATIRPYSSLKQFFSTVKAIVHRNDNYKYVYGYWPELDRIAHEHGIASKAAKAHLSDLNAAFAKFLKDIEGDNCTVILTADHGMIDSGPHRLIELDNHPELTALLAMPLCGERRIAYCYVAPSKRERFEAYVKHRLAEFATLLRSEELLELGYFGYGPPHSKLIERIGDYALIMKDNYTIKDWLPKERRHVHIGSHGGVSAEEMYVPLIVAQP